MAAIFGMMHPDATSSIAWPSYANSNWARSLFPLTYRTFVDSFTDPESSCSFIAVCLNANDGYAAERRLSAAWRIRATPTGLPVWSIINDPRRHCQTNVAERVWRW